MKKAAVIHDLSGFGKCSLTAAIPVLSALGVQCCPVATAVLTGQTGYPCYHCTDLTAMLPDYIDAWGKNNAHFDAIYSGFLTGAKQISQVLDFIRQFREEHTLLLVDPVMGDDGNAYPFFTPGLLNGMEELTLEADVITPNLTEACLLADVPCEHADWQKLMDRLSENGASVLITSAGDAVVGVDARTGMRFNIPFERVPGEHWGTGDRFCALLLDGLAHKMPFDRAAKRASDGVYEALKTENPANPIDKV